MFTRDLRCAYAVSHVSAAILLGWPVPWRTQVTNDLHVMTESKIGQLRVSGVCGHRGLERRPVIEHLGLTLVHPAYTWADLAHFVGRGKPCGFEDVVAAGDQAFNLVEDRRQLAKAVLELGRQHGKRTLLHAYPLLRRGSWSAGETRARLMFGRVGLPEPELNAPIRDREGRVVAVGDLVWRARRLVVEYQGEQFHTSPQQVAADLDRCRRLRELGWTVIYLFASDLTDPVQRTAKILQVADALGFPQARLRMAQAEPQFFAPQTLPVVPRVD